MKLLITKKAQKELDKVPDRSAKKIADQFLKLASNPFPPQSKKLKGDDNYRLRVGSFRVIYTLLYATGSNIPAKLDCVLRSGTK